MSYINKYPLSKYEPYVRILLADIYISKEKYSFALEQLVAARGLALDSAPIIKLIIGFQAY